MFELARSDELLIRLFERYFDDSAQALLRLERHLAQITLPFNLRSQLRELQFPAQPGLPSGVPSFIYYYVPGSGWGSVNQPPSDPLDMDFVYSGDGVGLNLGCPVRLLRALDVLAQLPDQDRKEARDGLASSTKHLATVEELLWSSGWKSQTELRRGGTIPGAKGDVDWSFKATGFPIYLEAKFRPSDWPRITDQETYVPKAGTFLAKALHKFPHPPNEPALYLVGIIAFANLTEEVLNVMGAELAAAPQIHGVIFRTLNQMTHVVARDAGMRDQILALLKPPSIRDYPTNYVVLFHIEERNKRVAERGKTPAQPAPQSPEVVSWHLHPRFDSPVTVPEPGAYRATIPSRGADGEPNFQVIPKHLAPDTGDASKTDPSRRS
jgi:hypothetical protein